MNNMHRFKLTRCGAMANSINKSTQAMWQLAAAILMMSMAKAQAAPNFAGNIDRPLHYRPDGDSFVVENGKEFFNRPLYGSNTAFRVDAGDKPEYSFYLP